MPLGVGGSCYREARADWTHIGGWLVGIDIGESSCWEVYVVLELPNLDGHLQGYPKKVLFTVKCFVFLQTIFNFKVKASKIYTKNTKFLSIMA